MRQTLFYIPHAIGPLPTFGPLSWGMIAFALYVIATLVWLRGKSNLSAFAQENSLSWLIGAGIAGWMLPMIESRIPDGTPLGFPVGLPVRGYGVLLMFGVLSALVVASKRMAKIQVQKDAFYSLALWSIIGGLLGARLFYIVQKWSELQGSTFSEKIWTSLQFTEGGLVVYGGAIGGLLTMGYWSWRHRINPIPLMDAVIPAFFIGLSLGRIGCLMNGCCYGGVCTDSLPTIQFPAGSPAYMDQLASGRLLGMRTSTTPSTSQPASIEEVETNSWADHHGVHPNQKLSSVEPQLLPLKDLRKPLATPEVEAYVFLDQKRFRVSHDEMPERSLPVHPAQIYASISAFFLFLWTLAIPQWSTRPGLVLGAGLIGYGILRIIEEIIRVDEAGQFGTSLSISQWISVVGIVVGIGFLAFALKRPPASVAPLSESQ